MKKLIFIGILSLCLFSEGYSQTGLSREALLFSRTTFGGSTRMQSLGGAHISLGGDISSALANPAGLGFYNRSEITFTPGLKIQNADSRFFQNNNDRLDGANSQDASASRGNFGLYNFGLVFNKPSEKEGKFRGWNLAFSVDRTNDFNEEISYTANNDFNSISFLFADNAGSLSSDDLRGLELAAFETRIINPALDGNNQLVYDPITLFDTATINGNTEFFYSYPVQQEVIRRSGSQSQWSFSAGGNYDDRIYFGGGIGITSIGYEEDKVFRETDFYVFGDNQVILEGIDPRLGGITLREDLRADGIGINATLGMIFRPVKYFTIGFSYITPTAYTISEESTFTLTNVLNEDILSLGNELLEAGSYEFAGDIRINRYSLTVPGKLNFGSSIFLGKYGFITGSIELTDYSRAELRSNDFLVEADNEEIRSLYSSVTNVRLGAEFRIQKFMLRAGYASLSNPFEAGLEPSSIESVSYGAGYRSKDFYVDLGVVHSSDNQLYSPYQLFDGSEPVISTDLRSTRIIATIGFTIN